MKKSEDTRDEDDGAMPKDDGAAPKGDVERKCLLAHVAGHVASGLLVSPSPKVNSSEKIATVAVDVAEAILKKVGL
jgi:hypothetical protein